MARHNIFYPRDAAVGVRVPQIISGEHIMEFLFRA